MTDANDSVQIATSGEENDQRKILHVTNVGNLGLTQKNVTIRRRSKLTIK